MLNTFKLVSVNTRSYSRTLISSLALTALCAGISAGGAAAADDIFTRLSNKNVNVCQNYVQAPSTPTKDNAVVKNSDQSPASIVLQYTPQQPAPTKRDLNLTNDDDDANVVRNYARSLNSAFDSALCIASDVTAFLEPIRENIINEKFSFSEEVINDLQEKIISFASKRRRELGKTDTTKVIGELLNNYAEKYEMHDYPQMHTSSSSAHNQLTLEQSMLNWKRWSCFTHMAARSNCKEARIVLLETLAKKADFFEDATDEENLPNRVEIISFYEDQIMFVKNLMLQKRYTYMGEVIESNCSLLLRDSKI
jgi:hypothetical protein